MQIQVDPIVAPGTEGTVTLPKTAHVLSLPLPDLGEMFVGYVGRVSLQAAGNPEIRGALFLGTDSLGDVRDPANWPVMADKFYNPRAYLTDAEKAKFDAAARQWAANSEKLKQHAQTPEAIQQQERVRKHKKEKKRHAAGDIPVDVPVDVPVDPNAIPIEGQG